MKKILFFLMLASLILSGSIEEIFKKGRSPNPDATALILLDRKEFSWKGSLNEEAELLIKILNKTGRDRYSDLRVRKGKGKTVEVLEAFTLKSNLKRLPVGKDSINVVTPPFLSGVPFYANGIEDIVYSYPSVEPNDGVYLKFLRKGGSSFSAVIYPMEEDPKELVKVKAIPPEGRKLKYSTRNFESKKEGNTFIWTTRTDMLYPEEFRPPYQLLSPYLIFSADKDWKETTSRFRKSFYSMLEKGGFKYSGKKDLPSLYKFITIEVKKVDLPLWHAGMDLTPLKKIRENGFADQRDKALVAVYLLRKAGYEAYPVLANSIVDIIKDVPTLKQIDTILVMYRNGKRWVFFEPNNEYSTIGSLSFSGKSGLVLKKDTVEWVKIKSLERNFSFFNAKILLDEKGNFTAELKTGGNGMFDSRLKSQLRYMKDEEKEKYFAQAADRFLRDARSLGWKILNINDFQKNAEVIQKISGQELGIVQKGEDGGEVMLVNLPQNPYYFTKFSYKTSLPERKYPLYIGEAQTFEMKMEIAIPEGWEVIYTPETINRSGNGWKFSVLSERKDGRVVITYRVELNTTMISKEDYRKFSSDQRILYIPSERLVMLKKKIP